MSGRAKAVALNALGGDEETERAVIERLIAAAWAAGYGGRRARVAEYREVTAAIAAARAI